MAATSTWPWSDTFTDVDTTPLATHNAKWTATGTLTIVGNALVSGSAGAEATFNGDLYDKAVPGYDYEALFAGVTKPTTNTASIRFQLRYNTGPGASPNQNSYGGVIVKGATDTLRTERRLANTFTTLGSTSQNWTNGHEFKVRITGQTLSIYDDGTLIRSDTVTHDYRLHEVCGTIQIRFSHAEGSVGGFTGQYIGGTQKTIVYYAIGAMGPTTARIAFGVSHAATVKVEYSTDSGLAGSSTSPGVAVTVDSDDTVATGRVDLTGLTAATLYYFRLLIDDVAAQVAGIGYPRFTTSPTYAVAGTTLSFAFGACNDPTTTDDLLMKTMADHAGLSFYVHLGDYQYNGDSVNPADIGKFRSIIRNQMTGGAGNNVPMVYLLHRLPGYTMNDDHDQNEALVSRTNFTDFFKPAADGYMFKGNPDPLTADEAYYEFSYGNIGFFVLDSRSFRDLNTCIGTVQLAALKARLLATKQIYRRTFLMPSTAADPYDQGDSWGTQLPAWQNNDLGTGATPAAGNLAEFLKDNNIPPPIVLPGDRHYYQASKLRNTEGLTGWYELLSAAFNKSSLAVLPNASSTITSISRTGGTVTLNTTSKHQMLVGETFYVTNVTYAGATPFNGGPFTVLTTPLATRLTYAQAGENGAGTVGGTSQINSTNIIWRGNTDSHYGVVAVDTTAADPTVTFTIYDKTATMLTGKQPDGTTVNATITLLESELNGGIVYTWSGPLPSVTTEAVSDIAATTATGNGTITDIGGENADARGIVYDTASQAAPGNVAPAASGYGSVENETGGSFAAAAFTESLTGLTESTTYYARAYAHNSYGYTYGDEVTFDTTAASVGAAPVLPYALTWPSATVTVFG